MTSASPTADSERLRELLKAYLAAEYRWQYQGNWYDIVIGLPHPGLELAYPEMASFGVLSAWNPLSVARDREHNRRADEALHQMLLASGHFFCPAFASARNRTWREPNWLVMGMPGADFDALSRGFGQLGTLWWLRGEPVRLRMDAARPDGATDDDFVDWLQ